MKPELKNLKVRMIRHKGFEEALKAWGAGGELDRETARRFAAQQDCWAFVLYKTEQGKMTYDPQLHFYIGPKATPYSITFMFSHEFGHLAGELMGQDWPDSEDRADSYAWATIKTNWAVKKFR